MKTENKVLMFQAREALSGKWGIAIAGFVLYELIVGIFSLVISILLVLVLGNTKLVSVLRLISLCVIIGPMVYGVLFFYLSLSRKQEAKIEYLFIGFKRFLTTTSAFILMMIFQVLWMLLLVIPGIVAGLSYSQTFFILTDDNSISALDAIKKSKKMMEGNKWKLFCLLLRFLGIMLIPIFVEFILVSIWGFSGLVISMFSVDGKVGNSGGWLFGSLMILCWVTFFALFLRLFPYMTVSLAKFYDDIKNDNGYQQVTNASAEVISPSVETAPVTTPIVN